jgi:hypothetical protein
MIFFELVVSVEPTQEAAQRCIGAARMLHELRILYVCIPFCSVYYALGI